ncbi:uncharacterized protein PG986_007802 [Apiospora aurea]|uniref:Uncharacterized protein n=1 Tax=Apiospora aurea TaxID=335848 RepID=A0ABR1QDN3_9PEZI
MAKKNKKPSQPVYNGGVNISLGAGEAKRSKSPQIVKRWDDYFQDDVLENWQRLMKDLGFQEEFRSKTQCRNALKKVWINIYDFLDAVKAGKPVYQFKTEVELSHYTKKTGRVYPKRHIQKGSPLARLMAHIFRH